MWQPVNGPECAKACGHPSCWAAYFDLVKIFHQRCWDYSAAIRYAINWIGLGR